MNPSLGSSTPATGVTIALLTAFIAAAYAFGIYMFIALVPEIRAELSFSHDDIGFITGTAQVGNTAFALISSLIAAKIGGLRTVYLFLVISAICQATLFGLSNFPSFLVVLFFVGGCGPAIWIAIVAASSQIIAVKHRAKALSVISSGTAFGLLLNGVFVPSILSSYGWRAVWLTVSGVTTMVILISLVGLWSELGREKKQKQVDRNLPRASWSDYKRLFVDPNSVLAIILLFGTAFSLIPFQAFLTSFLSESAGWSAESSVSIWAVVGVGGMLGGITLGTFADKFSVRLTLMLTFLGLALAIPVPLVAGDKNWIISIAAFFFGMGYFAIFGLIAANIASAFPQDIAAVITGTSFLAVGIGSAIGNVVAGAILESTSSYALLFSVLSGVSIALAGLSKRLPLAPADTAR